VNMNRIYKFSIFNFQTFYGNVIARTPPTIVGGGRGNLLRLNVLRLLRFACGLRSQ